MNHAAIVEKETIFHFTCQKCKGWFSIATMDEWQPGKLNCMYCPHCGDKLVTSNGETE